MKKIYVLILTLIFISINNVSFGSIINEEISKKYFDIFAEPELSKKDIINYKKIFTYQEICEWKKANKFILKIQNKILIGHVLAQRYLHPKCYRSKFLELSSWLKIYSDHPQAKRIYRLAIKRMPTG